MQGWFEHDLTEDDDRGRAIPDLLVLGTGQLDHRLGRRVADIDFTEDGVAVVGKDNACEECGAGVGQKDFATCGQKRELGARIIRIEIKIQQKSSGLEA